MFKIVFGHNVYVNSLLNGMSASSVYTDSRIQTLDEEKFIYCKWNCNAWPNT
jgi:hypothetical protein